MNIRIEVRNGVTIAVVDHDKVLLTSVESALDFLGSTRYETECDAMVFPKETITEAFFDLKTKLAGEILQKFVQYDMRIAIVGDFSMYGSKALNDFIYESNKGKHVYFAESLEKALEMLSDR